VQKTVKKPLLKKLALDPKTWVLRSVSNPFFTGKSEKREKSEFPALEKCLPYFSNPDIEENTYF
jgi:hypothetical protein